MEYSTLQSVRYSYQPKLPKLLRGGIKGIAVTEGDATTASGDEEKIKELFPKLYGQKELYFGTKGKKPKAKKHVVGVILS